MRIVYIYMMFKYLLFRLYYEMRFLRVVSVTTNYSNIIKNYENNYLAHYAQDATRFSKSDYDLKNSIKRKILNSIN